MTRRYTNARLPYLTLTDDLVILCASKERCGYNRLDRVDKVLCEVFCSAMTHITKIIKAGLYRTIMRIRKQERVKTLTTIVKHVNAPPRSP